MSCLTSQGRSYSNPLLGVYWSGANNLNLKSFEARTEREEEEKESARSVTLNLLPSNRKNVTDVNVIVQCPLVLLIKAGGG